MVNNNSFEYPPNHSLDNQSEFTIDSNRPSELHDTSFQDKNQILKESLQISPYVKTVFHDEPIISPQKVFILK
jgi:hypothetical protein